MQVHVFKRKVLHYSSKEDKDSKTYQKKKLIMKIKILLNSLDGHLEINLYS